MIVNTTKRGKKTDIICILMEAYETIRKISKSKLWETI